MGLVDQARIEQRIDKFTETKFPKYTDAELEHLSTRYSPKQLAALEAGEAAIDPRDLTVQGRLRTDPFQIPYIDDFAETQPIIDKRARNKDAPDPLARFMNIDEFTQDLIEWAEQFPEGEVTGTLKTLADFVPAEVRAIPEGQWPGEVRDEAHKAFQRYLQGEVAKQAAQTKAQSEGKWNTSGGPTDADILQYILERSGMTDGGRETNSSLALALPNKVPGVVGRYKKAIDPDDHGLDDMGVFQDLKRRTGMKVRDIINLRARRIVIRYVSNQTRLGKIRKASVIYIAGNGNGWLGLGEAKSTEPQIANLKARQLAIRNMQPIRRYEDRTIYGSVTSKVSGTVVAMISRPAGTSPLVPSLQLRRGINNFVTGFGLRVPHRIFEMCRAAGIQDLAAKMPRSRNPMNSVKAAYKALLNQPDPEEMAIGRGKKLVDVRKVYYGGNVY